MCHSLLAVSTIDIDRNSHNAGQLLRHSLGAICVFVTSHRSLSTRCEIFVFFFFQLIVCVESTYLERHHSAVSVIATDWSFRRRRRAFNLFPDVYKCVYNRPRVRALSSAAGRWLSRGDRRRQRVSALFRGTASAPSATDTYRTVIGCPRWNYDSPYTGQPGTWPIDNASVPC